MAVKKENAKRRHQLNATYNNMIRRCYAETDKYYHNQGGRGIRVCERWLENQENAQAFWNFVSDMGDKPTPAHSLDRTDNNGDYTPNNCRWASRAEQQRNRKNNIVIEFNGKRQTLKDWAIEIGKPNTTILGRFRKGLPIHIVLSKDNFRGKSL